MEKTLIAKDSKINVGIIGCGEVSGFYLDVCHKFQALNMLACSDLIEEKAKNRAKQFDIPKVYSAEQLLADPQIDVVLNLTVPQAHAEVGVAVLEAGKHLYTEKPLCIDCNQGQKLLSLAEKKGLLVGCAPDTFLGGGLQTCRKIIDDGLIGDIVGCTCFMMSHGTESWHSNPEFHYKLGSGPMFEMGPYYLTALINLIGPISRVTSSNRITFPQRVITSQPRSGQKIKVDVPTHVAAVMDFEMGAIGTIITSFDVWATQLPNIEIYGSNGTLSLPDPNSFGGPVRICYANSNDWQDVPLSFGYAEQSRGVGLADMAQAILSGRRHRADGRLAYHALEVMSAIGQAGQEKKYIDVISTCKRPEPLPMGLEDGLLDL